MTSLDSRQPDPLQIGDLVIDSASHEAWVDNRRLQLTNLEFELLLTLAEHPGWVFSPQELLHRVWGYEYVADTRLVSVHIGNLRRKLSDSSAESALAAPDSGWASTSSAASSIFIETVRGAGYRLARPLPTSGPTTFLIDAHTPDHRTDMSRLVGREHEARRLLEAFERARSGCGSFVVLEGESGMGKKTLARLLSDQASERGALVLRVRGHQSTANSSYWPWAHNLRTLAEVLPREQLRRCLRGVSPRLATLAPDFGEAFEQLLACENQDMDNDPRAPLNEALLQLIRRLAAERTVVFVFEALEQFDDASLPVLELLAERVKTARVLALATLNPTDGLRRPVLLDTLSELEIAGCERMELRPLTREETAALAELTAGEKPSTAVIDSIYRESDGNPFCVREFARLLRDSGRLTDERCVGPDELPLPAEVRAAVDQRLSHLTPESRTTLGLAALIGRSFDIALLRAASHLDGPRFLEALDEALQAQVIESEGHPGVLRFAHPITRRAVIAGLGEVRRLDAHWRIGKALERRARDDEPDLDRLAHHFGESAALRDANKAVEYCRRAGIMAMQANRDGDAFLHFRRAHDLLPLTHFDAYERQQASVALRESAGDALRLAGRPHEAVAWYQRALLLLGDEQADRARLYSKIDLACAAVRLATGTAFPTAERVVPFTDDMTILLTETSPGGTPAPATTTTVPLRATAIPPGEGRA